MDLHNDLSVPEWLHAALSQLSEIFRTFDSSLAVATASPENQAEEMESVLEAAYQPYLDLQKSWSNSLPEGHTKIVFDLNSFATIKGCLEGSEYFTRLLSSSPSEITNSVATFYSTILFSMSEARDQLKFWASQFLANESGCETLLDLIDDLGDSPATTLESNEAFSPEQLEEASQKLDDFLPSALMDVMDELRQLGDESLKSDVVEEAVERFCADFERLEDALGDMSVDEEDEKDEEGYDSEDEMAKGRRRYFPRTNGEIRVLLS